MVLGSFGIKRTFLVLSSIILLTSMFLSIILFSFLSTQDLALLNLCILLGLDKEVNIVIREILIEGED